MAKKRKKKKEPLPGNFPRWLRDALVIIISLGIGLGAGHYLSGWSERRSEESSVATTEVVEKIKEAVAEGEIPAIDPDIAETVADGPPKDAEDIAMTAPVEEKVDEEQPLAPVDGTPENPVTLNPPAEATGGLGDPQDRLADGSGEAPEAVVESCAEFLVGELGEDMRLKLKDGPLKAGFEVEFDGLINPWSLITTTRMPEDSFDVVVLTEDEGDSRNFTMDSDHGVVATGEGTTLSWKAPKQPGIYCVKILEKDSDNKMCFHVAVLHPWDGESEELNGYRIGKYQDKPFRDNPRYKKPRGFIEVTEENKDMWISPHLQLSQFVCKQKADYPKYMLIDPRLLLKLEGVVEELEKSGRGCNHLYISSGYRTPAYNKALGNKTSYSRHLYGDAADMFVDNNQDGRIDDLDFSGSVDDGDARFIQEKVQAVTDTHRYLMGGLGFYSSASYRNPFIHLDTRGYSARWSK